MDKWRIVSLIWELKDVHQSCNKVQHNRRTDKQLSWYGLKKVGMLGFLKGQGGGYIGDEYGVGILWIRNHH